MKSSVIFGLVLLQCISTTALADSWWWKPHKDKSIRIEAKTDTPLSRQPGQSATVRVKLVPINAQTGEPLAHFNSYDLASNLKVYFPSRDHRLESVQLNSNNEFTVTLPDLNQKDLNVLSIDVAQESEQTEKLYRKLAKAMHEKLKTRLEIKVLRHALVGATGRNKEKIEKRIAKLSLKLAELKTNIAALRTEIAASVDIVASVDHPILVADGPVEQGYSSQLLNGIRIESWFSPGGVSFEGESSRVKVLMTDLRKKCGGAYEHGQAAHKYLAQVFFNNALLVQTPTSRTLNEEQELLLEAVTPPVLVNSSNELKVVFSRSNAVAKKLATHKALLQVSPVVPEQQLIETLGFVNSFTLQALRSYQPSKLLNGERRLPGVADVVLPQSLAVVSGSPGTLYSILQIDERMSCLYKGNNSSAYVFEKCVSGVGAASALVSRAAVAGATAGNAVRAFEKILLKIDGSVATATTVVNATLSVDNWYEPVLASQTGDDSEALLSVIVLPGQAEARQSYDVPAAVEFIIPAAIAALATPTTGTVLDLEFDGFVTCTYLPDGTGQGYSFSSCVDRLVRHDYKRNRALWAEHIANSVSRFLISEAHAARTFSPGDIIEVVRQISIVIRNGGSIQTPVAVNLPLAGTIKGPRDTVAPYWNVVSPSANFGHIRIAPLISATLTDDQNSVVRSSVKVELLVAQLNGETLTQDLTNSLTIDCTTVPGTCSLNGSVPALEGGMTLRFSGSDVAGNASNVFTAIGQFDSTVPQLTHVVTYPNAANQPRFEVRASDSSPLGVLSVEFANGQSCVGATTPLLCHFTLPDGAHQYTVRATDLAGNEATAIGEIVLDATPPQFLSLMPSAGTVVDGLEQLVFGVSNERLSAANLTLTSANGFSTTLPLTIAGDGVSFSATINAPSVGEYLLSIELTDRAGLTTSQSLMIEFRSLLPSAPHIASTLNDHVVISVNTIHVPVVVTSDTAIVTTVIRINGIEAFQTTSKNFAAPVILNVGSNTIEITATDSFGQTAVPLIFNDIVFNPPPSLANGPNGSQFVVPSVNLPVSLSNALLSDLSVFSSVSALATNRNDTFSCGFDQPLTPPGDPNEALSSSEVFTAITPKINDLAQQLGSADAAYAYVRDHIRFMPRFGATQTAEQVLITGVGTAIDKSTLLIALLRALNIPAQYVTGDVLVPEDKLKSLYGVRDEKDLAWANLISLRGYFQARYQPSFDPEQMVYYVNGRRAWQIPHAWVYAQVETLPGQREWIEVDATNVTTELESGPEFGQQPENYYGLINNFLSELPSLIATPVDAPSIVRPWTFASDPLIRAQVGDALAIETQGFRSSVTIEESGLSVHTGFSIIPNGTLAVGARCIKAQASILPDSYSLKSYVRVGGVNAPLLEFSEALALTSRDAVSITHSAGLLGELPAGATLGNLVLSQNGSVQSQAAMPTLAKFNLYHAIQEPIAYGGLTEGREVQNLTAGGVYVINHAVAPIVTDDVVNEQKLGFQMNQAGMVRLLRVAGLSGLARAHEEMTYLNRWRSVNRVPSHLMITLTEKGVVQSKPEVALGYSLNEAAMDWVAGGTFYQRVGNFSSINQYSNLKLAQGDFIVNSSSLEHLVWEDLFGVNAVSTVKALQIVNENNYKARNTGRLQDVVDVIMDTFYTTDSSVALIQRFATAMQAQVPFLGQFVTQSPKIWSTTNEVQYGAWKGVAYLLLPSTPFNGGGAFLATDGVAGGTPLAGAVVLDNSYTTACGQKQWPLTEEVAIIPVCDVAHNLVVVDYEVGAVSYRYNYAEKWHWGLGVYDGTLISLSCDYNRVTGGRCEGCKSVLIPEVLPPVCDTINIPIGGQFSIPAGLAAFNFPAINLPPIAPPQLLGGPPTLTVGTSGVSFDGRRLLAQTSGGAAGNSSTSNTGCTSGQPVNLETGSMWHEFVDFEIAGRTQATDLVLRRTYLSDPAGDTVGDFGRHWRHAYESRIYALPYAMSEDPARTGLPDILWVDQAGGPWTFFRTDVHTFRTPPGFLGKFEELDDKYVVTLPGNVQHIYSRGHATLPPGLLTEIIEPHGEKIEFNRDANGLLSEVASGLAGTIIFSRNGAGLISEAFHERDGLSVTYEYDAQNRLISSTDWSNRTTTYEYNSGQAGTKAHGLLSAIIDPIGRAIRYTYYDNGQSFEQTEPGNGYRAFQYSADRANTAAKWTKVRDIDGRTNEYRFDKFGRIISTINADGSQQRTTWLGNLGAGHHSFDELGSSTLNSLDIRGNLASFRRGDMTGFDATYHPVFDKPVAVNNIGKAQFTYAIDFNDGDILAVHRIGATLESIRFTHDAFGNVLSVNNGLSTYTHATDADGRYTYLFDAHNPQILTYDARSRVHTRSFASGRMLTYTYDDFNRVTRIDDSHGPAVANTYDLMGRLKLRSIIPTDAGVAQTTAYDYDERDRVVAITDAMNRTTRFVYDRPAIGCGVVDRPVKVIDPAGRATTFEYDVRQRLARKIDASNAVTRYEYNLRGDLLALTDAEGNRTRFYRDGGGKPFRIERPSVYGAGIATTEITNLTYDGAGRLFLKQQSRTGGFDSVSTQWEYNSHDRLARRTQKKRVFNPQLGYTETVMDDSTYTYHPLLDADLLATAENAHVRYEFGYNFNSPFSMTGFATIAKNGNPLNLIEGQWSLNHDVTGEVAAINQVAGPAAISMAFPMIESQYDAAGRLSQITGRANGHELSTNLTYDGFGRKQGVVHSNNVTGSYSYDLLNRTTSVYWDDLGANPQAPFRQNITYNALTGNIDQTQREIGTFNYTHDNTDQLLSVAYNGAAITSDLVNRSWSFDKVGNRITDTVNGQANHIANAIVQNSKSFFEYSNTGAGEITKKIDRTTNAEERFEYRPDGRTIGYENAELVASYAIDPLGRRIAKVITKKADNSSFTQSYLHQATFDQILLARAGNGDLYLYLNEQHPDQKFGEVSVAGAKSYITDYVNSIHNNDSAGSTRLLALHGEILSATSTISATSDPTNFGWQGLQHDLESGEIYNRARMYSSDIGRFTSIDPLGFDSGETNLFISRKNNPLMYVDPNGKIAWFIFVPAIIGGMLIPTPSDTSLPSSSEFTIPAFGSLIGAGAGGICRMAWTGSEITLGSIRFAPFGNRTGHPTGRFPHYHRRGTDPKGNTLPGQSDKRHRPWDKKPNEDKSWWNRF